MYNVRSANKTKLKVNQAKEGEMIEQKVERILNNGEPITDGAPIIHTERKDGVNPGHNIRTDRFEVAIDAMDKVSASRVAKREARIIEMNKKEGDGKPESTQGGADNNGGNSK